MEIGVYLCLGSFFYLLGLMVLTRPSKKVVIYTFLSMAMGCILVAAFYGMSYLLGFGRIGQITSYSYPQDYFGRGVLGWVAMLLLPLGLLSPLLATFLIAKRYGTKS